MQRQRSQNANRGAMTTRARRTHWLNSASHRIVPPAHVTGDQG